MKSHTLFEIITQIKILEHPKNPRFKNLTGLRFGRFTVISYAGHRSPTVSAWNCVCDCGNSRVVQGGNLKTHPNISCGCFRRENTSNLKKIHGMRNARPYRIWAGMKSRCTNPDTNRSHIYFSRGIRYCEHWNTFQGFWGDMKDGYKSHLTLERKNNDLGYSKENCKWATYKEQANNRRKSSK